MNKHIYIAIAFTLVFGGLTLLTYRGLFMGLTGLSGLFGIILLNKEQKRAEALHRASIQAFKQKNKKIYDNRLAKRFANRSC